MRHTLMALMLGVTVGWLISAGVAQAINPIDPAPSASAGYQIPSPLAPGDPEEVTLAGSAAAASQTSLAGKCVRVSCDTAVSYRKGTTALSYPDGGANVTSHYNKLSANTAESMCFKYAETTLAFYSASAGTCTIGPRE